MSAMKKALMIAAALAATVPLTAFAKADDVLEVTTRVEKEIVVESDDGEQVVERVAADVVTPGERVVYTITFKNVGVEPAENSVITNPIAESLVYVAGSATNDGVSVEFSIDGGQTFGPATTKDFTHVRWVMQSALAAGAEGQMSFAADLE